MKQLIDLLKATPIERMEGNSQVRIIDVTADSRAVKMERQLLLRKRKSMWPRMLQLFMLPIHEKRWKI